MKAFSKGAVYLCSQTHLAKAVYKGVNSGYTKYGIDGHKAAHDFSLFYNRPVIVMDNVDLGGAVKVIPITHKVSYLYPPLIVSGFPKPYMKVLGADPNDECHFEEGYAAIDWINTVKRSELWKLLGFVEDEEMEDIDDCIKYINGYGPKPQIWIDWEVNKNAEKSKDGAEQIISELEAAKKKLEESQKKYDDLINATESRIKTIESYHLSHPVVEPTVEETKSDHREADNGEEVLTSELIEDAPEIITDPDEESQVKDIHPEIPSYVIGDTSHLKYDPSDQIGESVIKNSTQDSGAIQFLRSNPMSYAQAVSIATISDPAVKILLHTDISSARRIKDACSNIIESICDFTVPVKMLRKHQIIFALADKEELKNDPISTICAKYNISKKKAQEFKEIARAAS